MSTFWGIEKLYTLYMYCFVYRSSIHLFGIHTLHDKSKTLQNLDGSELFCDTVDGL